jgi:sugar phosphate isomerase/epimerase
MLNCVSNLAWKKNEEKKAFQILKKNKIKFLEFAPSLLLNKNFNERDIKRIKKKCFRYGLKLLSMQSILYNVKNAFIFGSKYQNKIFYAELKKKVKLAKKLGVKIIIFGSPFNKKKFGKKNSLLDKIFINTFQDISSLCKKNNVTICLEPNPKIYKSDYLLNTNEAVKIIKKINRKNILLNFDLGASLANKENVQNLVEKNISHIGHVQISAPKLKNLQGYKKRIKNFLNALKKMNYRKAISMEVLAKKKDNLVNLEKNIRIIYD